jgi:hypothetical protein
MFCSKTAEAELTGADRSRRRAAMTNPPTALEKQASRDVVSLMHSLQRTIGNQAVLRLMTRKTGNSTLSQAAAQARSDTSDGRERIARALPHALHLNTGKPVLQRTILYPGATVTTREDPIPRFMRGASGTEGSLALTTLTINGAPAADDAAMLQALASALNPKQFEAREAPARPAPAPRSGSGSGSGSGTGVGSGSGSGSGSGTGAGSGSGSGAAATTSYCGFANFDINISANIRLPNQPANTGWGPEVVKRPAITRGGLPQTCGRLNQISVLMKGDPNSNSFYQWVVQNENQHATDMKDAAVRFLEPDHRAVLALRGSGKDPDACTRDLNQQLNRLSQDNVAAFIRQVKADIARRDSPGGHKYDVYMQDNNNCNDLEITLKKTPAPSGGGGH